MTKKIYPLSALGVLMNSPLFEGFSEKELEALLPTLQPVFKHYTKDNIVVEEGEPSNQIGFVAKGRIVAKKMSSGGRTHILAVHEPGSDFGFDAVFTTAKTSPLTFIADTDCIALFISADSFIGHTDSTSIRIINNANHILANKCVRLLYKTDILSKMAMRDKIIAYFAILTNKSQSKLITPKMSREQLAQYLCVNRCHLSRELSAMQKEGLIELKRNGQVLVKSELYRLIRKESADNDQQDEH